MKRSTLAGTVAAWICLGLSAPLLAAEPAATGAATNPPGRQQQQQIAAATPVTGRDASFRSDRLLGADLRNSQNAALDSVDDTVISPATGKPEGRRLLEDAPLEQWHKQDQWQDQWIAALGTLAPQNG